MSPTIAIQEVCSPRTFLLILFFGPPRARWTRIFYIIFRKKCLPVARQPPNQRESGVGQKVNTSRTSLFGHRIAGGHRSISTGGVPQKKVNKEYKDFSPNCSVKCRVLKLRFLAFPGGPGGFRELREAGRNHFHLSWYLLVPGITSYDQKSYIKIWILKEGVQGEPPLPGPCTPPLRSRFLYRIFHMNFPKKCPVAYT